MGIYYQNLLFALAEIDRENRYFLLSSSWKDRFPQQNLPSFAFQEFLDKRYPVRLLNYLWQTWRWPPLDRFFREDLDLTHSPIPLILPTGGKSIVTVYDLFFMDRPQLVSREARKSYRRRIGDSLHKADGVLTISQMIKDRVIERFEVEKSKVRAVYLGVDKSFSEEPTEDALQSVRRKYALPASFLLFVGSIEPRKNLVRLVESLSLVHRDNLKIPLVVAGKKERDYDRVMDRIGELDLGSQVLFLSFVSSLELRVLYRLATALVFPSLNEGFGLPVVEAMASGLPCALSRAPALPEIAQQAAAYFDPEDTEEMARTIIRVVQDEDLRTDLIHRGRERAEFFSWKKTAEETLRFYKSVGEGEDLS